MKLFQKEQQEQPMLIHIAKISFVSFKPTRVELEVSDVDYILGLADDDDAVTINKIFEQLKELMKP